MRGGEHFWISAAAEGRWHATLFAVSEDSPQLGEVHLHGAKEGNTLQSMTVPQHFVHVPTGSAPSEALQCRGQMYVKFAQAIQTGKDHEPTLTAIQLHRLIDAIKQASNSGQKVKFS
jgi:hypothetical protein